MILGEAALFGAVQGLAEFLPISSSGHLLLLHSITHFSVGDDLTFDVALHLGTLLALLAYFWHDLWRLVRSWFRNFGRWQMSDPDQRLAWWLLIATIPGAIAGALLESAAESTFRQPALVALTLIGAGIVLWLADRFGRSDRALDRITWWQALLVGLAQMFAVVPGISRSGVTITAGRWLGFDRPSAARFSFLLATPITAGAVLKKLFELRHESLTSDQRLAFIVGAAVAAIVGYVVIRALLRFLSRHSYAWFTAYRIVLGLTVLAIVWLH